MPGADLNSRVVLQKHAHLKSKVPLSLTQKGQHMNKDQVEGTLDKAKGNVKEAVGKTIGNEKLEAEGKADQVSGAVQKKVGDVKDAVDTLTKKP